MFTRTQEAILAFLLTNPDKHITIRGLARSLDKSYTLVYNNLAKLEEQNLIIKKSVPPAKVITLNEFGPTGLFIDIERQIKRELLQKHPWIKIMLEDILTASKNVFFILLVFGSYAKGTQKKDSDIDLLFIFQDKKDIKKVENSITQIHTKVKKSFNFIDVNDFREMIRTPNELNIGNETKKHHILLHGVELYYQILSY